MNVTKVLTKNYENIAINIEDPAFRGRNSNPIQTQTNPITEKLKMNVTSLITADYENIAINIEDPAFRGRNPNPNKPNFKGGIIIKNMNIEVEVEDPALDGIRPSVDGIQTQTNPISNQVEIRRIRCRGSTSQLGRKEHKETCRLLQYFHILCLEVSVNSEKDSYGKNKLQS